MPQSAHCAPVVAPESPRHRGCVPRPRSLRTAEVIATYNPAIGRHPLVTPMEWAQISALVHEIAAPFAQRKGEQIRSYLRAATKLTAFVLHLEGELTVQAVLSETVIRGFLRQLPAGARDEEPYLWRLAIKHRTVAATAPVVHEIGRIELKPPYSAAEIQALLGAARAQRTELRRLNILAIVVLGAGAGLVRQSVRDVCAADVHEHGDGMFVRAAGRCARVLPEFEEALSELVRLRPKGRLLGPAKPKYATVKAHEWLDRLHGVPRLSVDRLRATYIVALLSGAVALNEVAASTGHQDWAALVRYATFLPPPPACPRGADQ